MIPAFKALAGFLMLILGRQFYAIFVAGMVFIVIGYFLERAGIVSTPRDWLLYPGLTALLAGALTFILKRGLALLAGFLAGVYIVRYLPGMFGGVPEINSIPALLVGGVVVVLLMFVYFDGVTILASSLVGALLMAINLPIAGLDRQLMFILFTVFGLVAQYVLLQYGRSAPD